MFTCGSLPPAGAFLLLIDVLLTTNKQTSDSWLTSSDQRAETRPQLLAVFTCVFEREIQDRCAWLKPAAFVFSGGPGLFRLSGLLIGCFVLDDSEAQTQRLVTEESRVCDHVREGSESGSST